MDTVIATGEETPVDDRTSANYSVKQSSHAYTDGPRSALGLYGFMRWGLIAYIAIEVAFQALLSGYLVFPDHLPSFMYQQSADDIHVLDAVGFVYFAICVVAFFFACRFTYRTMRNLHTIGSPAAEISPTWSVGFYFVPLANLAMPANAMSQIYHGTHEAVGEKSRHASPIPIWWSCWLLGGILESIADRSSLTGIWVFAIYATSALMSIVAAIVLMRMGSKIANKQELLKHGGIAHVFD